MKQRIRRMERRLAMLLAVLQVMLLLAAVPVRAADDVVDSGTCGDNLTWTLDSEGTLTISGTGDIPYSAFNGDKRIKTVVMEHGVTDIVDYAFDSCTSLSSIVIPDGVTSIGCGAFEYCTSLSSIELPDSVTSIGGSAFSRCSSLSSIELPDSVTSIGGYAFKDCSSLSSIEIPDGVTSIGDYAFSGCSSLSSIEIPDGVTSIGGYAFDRCSSLSSIEIPDGVTSIESKTFFNCSSLSSIEIPDGVTSIGDDAFYWCFSLSSIELPASLTSIGDYAFWLCKNLSSIEIPDGVTSIGEYAFYDCSSLNSISLPDSLTSIGTEAFSISKHPIVIFSGKDVYYGGSESDWSNIDFAFSNKGLFGSTIHYNSSGALFSWINSAGANIPADQYGIIVVGSDGKPISGASVTWSYGKVIGNDFSETKQTDQTGAVLFPRKTEGEPLIEVSCDGYKSYTNKGTNYAKSDKGYDVIRLYQESESDLLLRYAKYKDSTNLLTGVKTLNLKNTGNLIGDLTSGDFTISCQAINPDKVQSYQLWQNENKIADSADGSFSLNVDDGFAAGGGCLIRTIGTDGAEVDTPINLTFTKNEYNKASGIKLGDEIKFTAKDNVPFLGGGTFSIGDLPLLPVEVEVTEDKIYIGFNAKIVGGSNDAEKKERFADFKDSLAKVWKGNMALGKRDTQLINAMMKKEPDFALPGGSVKVNVVGYGEGDIGSTTATGEIYVLCKASTKTFGFTTWVVVVPVTVQISGEFTAQAGAKISYDWEKATLVGEIPVSTSLALKAFGGVGVGKVAGAGAYGSAKLALDMAFLRDPFVRKVDLTGELGVKAYVGPFEYARPFAYNTWHLYSSSSVARARMLPGSEAAVGSEADQDAYQLSDLSYLEEESEWLGENGGISLMSIEDENTQNQLTPLQTDTYRNMQPVIGSANGTPVMVWTRADTSRTTANAAQLVYSVYSDGAWSQPKPVNPDNTTADGAAKLASAADGTLYVIYQNANQEWTDDVTAADYAAAQGITAAKFSTDTMGFENVTDLSVSGIYAYAPVICMANGIPTAVWISNEDTSNMLGQNATNCLVYAQLKDGTWSKASTLAEGMNAVVSLAAGEVNGELCIAVATDQDNDRNTQGSQLTLFTGLKGEKQTLGEDCAVPAIQIAKLPDSQKEEIIWADENGLYAFDGTAKRTVVESTAFSSGFIALSDRILLRSAEESNSNLYTMVYDNGWQEPVSVTEQSGYLQSYAAAEIGDKTYLAAVQADVTISEDAVEDVCTLSWMTIEHTTDLQLTSAAADEEAAASGEDFPIVVDVKNNGDTKVTEYSVAISCNGETVAEQKVEDALAAGQETELTLTVPALGAADCQKKYTATVTADSDMQDKNNSVEFTAGTADLEIAHAELLHVGDTYSVLVNVRNNSVIPASGKLKVYYGAETLGEIDIGELNQGESTLLSAAITRPIYSGTTDVQIGFTISSDTEEWNELNNTTELYMDMAPAEHVHNYVNPVVVEPTCTQKGYTKYQCSGCEKAKIDKNSYTKALGHDSELKNAKEATCKEAGYTGDEVCKVCGTTIKKGRTIRKLAHTYDEGKITTAPTCEAEGTKTYTCTACGTTRTEPIPAAGHSWSGWKTVREATDTEDGLQERTCASCGAVQQKKIPSAGHEFAFVETVAPTCTEEGYDIYRCECGEEEHRNETAALGHDYALQNVVEATCTTEGYSGDWICTRCGETAGTGNTVPALGHDWSDWTEETAATYLNAGTEYRTCSACGETETEEIPALGSPFPDVQDPGKYYYTPVLWAAANNITNGVEGGLFAPGNTCKREQVVTFLWRAMGSPEPTSADCPFEDVAEGKYYYKAVLWAVENGITTGKSATRFAPKDTITRAEFVTFLWRTEGKPGYSTSNPFYDVSSGSYYYDAVLWASENGVTTGKSATKFAPKDPCTRGQVVTFLYRDLG